MAEFIRAQGKAIRPSLTILQADGQAATGETAWCAVQRDSDKQWWSFGGSAWATKTWGEVVGDANYQLALADQANGRYDGAAWPQNTNDASAERTYYVGYYIAAGGIFASAAVMHDEWIFATEDVAAAASVTGAVGSVAGNVDGSIGSLAAQAKLDVNAEADSALADYDPPTKGEMDSAHSTTDALINGLTDLDAAGAEAACDAALATYDGPTKAEMDSGHSLLAVPGDVTAAHVTTDALVSGLNDLSAAGAEAACDASLATYDGPTNAEMLTAHTVTDALIAALQDLSQAEAQAACTAALAVYDGPTKAEMDSGHALLAVPGDVTGAHTTTDALIGGLNDLSAAEAETAADNALATYDGPTDAEMLAAHVATDADIAALENLSQVEAQAAATAALAAYDPPTAAEMLASFVVTDALVSGLNDPTAAAIAAAVRDVDIETSEATAATGTSLGEMLAAIRAVSAGQLSSSGQVYSYYDVADAVAIIATTIGADFTSRTAAS